MAVALLRDIRNGTASGSLGAIVFWFMVGGAAGSWAACAAGPGQSVRVALVGGSLAGLCVGLYAALGTARISRVLALPGILIDKACAFFGGFW